MEFEYMREYRDGDFYRPSAKEKLCLPAPAGTLTERLQGFSAGVKIASRLDMDHRYIYHNPHALRDFISGWSTKCISEMEEMFQAKMTDEYEVIKRNGLARNYLIMNPSMISVVGVEEAFSVMDMKFDEFVSKYVGDPESLRVLATSAKRKLYLNTVMPDKFPIIVDFAQ
jgi:hypothetical protein